MPPRRPLADEACAPCLCAFRMHRSLFRVYTWRFTFLYPLPVSYQCLSGTRFRTRMSFGKEKKERSDKHTEKHSFPLLPVSRAEALEPYSVTHLIPGRSAGAIRVLVYLNIEFLVSFTRASLHSAKGSYPLRPLPR